MSAYASLVSLLQILETILAPRSCWNFHNRAQHQSLSRKVTFFLNFLDDSSAYDSSEISALETKIRAAAHRAEDLIESQISRSLQFKSRSLRVLPIVTAINLCFLFLLLSSEEAITKWNKILMLLIVTYRCALRAFKAWDIVAYHPQELHDLSPVFVDMNSMVKEVDRTKATYTSASAALLSLRKILDPLLQSGGQQMSTHRAHLKSLNEKLTSLLDFLGNASAYTAGHGSTLKSLETEITDLVKKARRLVPFAIPSQLNRGVEMQGRSSHKFLDLGNCIVFIIFVTIDRDWIDWLMMCWVISSTVAFSATCYLLDTRYIELQRSLNSIEKKKYEEFCKVIYGFSIMVTKCKSLPAAAAAASSSTRRDLEGSGRDLVVGLDSDLIEIKARLLQDSSERELVSIVGMGGIGKTTLARLAYKDPAILTHFDVRAWVTVSQECSLRHALLCLLDCTQMLTEGKRRDEEEELGLYLYQHLSGRRYLIVMDDVWDKEIWDSLSRFLPENSNGSRVLLTSRLSDVANYPDSASPLHRMQCLDEDKSWDLLREKIFGEEGCPLDLESIGKEIATSCRGLPLAIVVIGGLLYKDIQIEVWRDVARKLKNSELQDVKEQCLEILGLSYNHLPHYLRPCLLYMGVFLADSEISISRLINLWVAEGFIQPRAPKTPEDVAEGYLEDLISRNLILVRKRSCSGKMRTCGIHDLLRDVCVQNARGENFLHVVDSEGETPDESPRRLSIHPDTRQVNATLDSVRSVFCVAAKPFDNPLASCLRFVYLRVLDVLEVHFVEFPHQIVKLVHLRYLALCFDGSLPASISELQNLETIVHHSSSRDYPFLPGMIWSMPNLRHVYVKPGCYLLNALRCRLSSSFSLLPNLQTLVGIINFKWSKSIIKHIPNLKKLSIFYHVSTRADLSNYQLESLVDLGKLESLKIICKYDDLHSAKDRDPPRLALPENLRKLSLSGCRFPWASISVIGALPNLEVLKLTCEAFSGPSWLTVEGEFPQLVFLLLEEMSFTSWESDEASHFPLLQCLVLRSCDELQEIPSSIGDIPTLETIHLACCDLVEASAKQILEDQEEVGNETLKIVIERRNERNVENADERGGGRGGFRIARHSILSAGDEIMYAFELLLHSYNRLVMKRTKD